MKRLLSLLITAAIASQSSANVFDSISEADTEAVREWIHEHSESIDDKNDWGVTPLHFATMKGDYSIASALIAAGADPDVCDNHARTVIYKAIMSGSPDIVSLLIEEGADVNARDQWQNTPLHFSVYLPNPEIMEILLANGADPNLVDQEGSSPLIAAARGGQTKLALLLLKKGADVSLINGLNKNALLFAAERGLHGLVVELLERGADSELRTNDGQQTAAHLAAINGYGKVLKLLQKKYNDKNSLDAWDKSPDDYFKRYGAPVSEEEQNKIDMALNSGNIDAQVVYTDHSGWMVRTPGHLLVFDYWKPNTTPDFPSFHNGYVDARFARDLPVVVFVSHDHQDHFDEKAIKAIVNTRENVSFVFGFESGKPAEKGDAPYLRCNQKEKIAKYVVSPRETLDTGDWKVTSIQSNDSGAGFLVEVDGLTLFHAGDHANVDADKESVYYDEIRFLQEKATEIDIAFLPVSGCPASWQLDAVEEGFFATAKMLKARTVFPMHGRDFESSYRKVADKALDFDCSSEIICVNHPGDTYQYKSRVSATASL